MTNQEQMIKSILAEIGEDTTREGLVETPARVIRSWKEIYGGYLIDPKSILTTFAADGTDQMVILKDIEFYSMCEHHMLPFVGKAHIAYMPDPNGQIVGISKLARLLDIYARRLQIQERIGEQVTTTLMELIKPLGAICVIEAQHLCMKMRGVGKQNSIMVTSSLKGSFATDKDLKAEFLQLIK